MRILKKFLQSYVLTKNTQVKIVRKEYCMCMCRLRRVPAIIITIIAHK